MAKKSNRDRSARGLLLGPSMNHSMSLRFAAFLTAIFLGAAPGYAKLTEKSAPDCGANVATLGVVPEGLANLSLPGTALEALGRLQMASKEWQLALEAFQFAPNDAATRERFAPYAPYHALFVAYVAFTASAKDAHDLTLWPESERLAAIAQGVDREVATALETAHRRFVSEWASTGKKFWESSLGRNLDAREQALPPVRLQFADRQLAEFFAKGRVEDTDSLQRYANTFSWARYARIALRRLELLNATQSLEDLRLRTKELKLYGKGCQRAGYYGIEIDHQFRLLFHWDFKTGSAYDVFIEDYHAE